MEKYLTNIPPSTPAKDAAPMLMRRDADPIASASSSAVTVSEYEADAVPESAETHDRDSFADKVRRLERRVRALESSRE